MTVTSAVGDRPSHLPKALIVEGTAGGTNNAFSLPMREEDEPVFTVRTGNMPRAILFGHDSKLTTRDGDEPAFTSTAESDRDLRPIAVRPAPEPAPTVKSSKHKGLAKGLLETGRVVQMTPEALGRFQTLPRWYKLSGNRRRDCTGIGNGVACLMAKAIIRSVME